jgi:purine-binding chemotaxis protein CheW
VTAHAFLTAAIGQEEYAIPLARVHEIVPCEDLTRVPAAADFVLGLARVHGLAVPVVDLARRFGAALVATPGRSVVVVQMQLRRRTALVGIAIDRLGRVMRVAPDDVYPPPPLEAVVAVEFLTGVFAGEDRFVLCLDVDRVLGADEEDAVAALAEEAHAAAPVRVSAARVPYLCVRVAGESCALALGRLREIAPCGAITAIPGAPPFVLGATNVRGAIVAVVDVGRRYGLAATRVDNCSSLLLVDVEQQSSAIGIVVEEILGLHQVPADALDRTPPFGTRFPSEIVLGMAPVGGAFVPVIDTSQALAETATEGVAG